MIGRKIGPYLIRERVGAGGMGEVYRAHDERLDRDVALKLLPAGRSGEDAARARLLREARAAASLNHPHICTIHEVGEAEGLAYIAMELIEGRTLAECIPAGGMPLDQVLRYGAQIADALDHAHARHIVHRDLKSPNVVITADGRAKVLDFGLARRLDGTDLSEASTRSHGLTTQPGILVGTLAYMAPEQLRGLPADARSDLWALGAVLYEMTSGRRPFHGETGFELSSAILNRSPEPFPAEVPGELKAIIEHCLRKEPSQRYQRAGEVRAALEAVGAGGAAGGKPAGASRRGSLARYAWPAVVAVTLIMATAMVGLDVGGLRTRLFGAPAPTIRSLAVLPLQNMSRGSDQDYFADGMTEALITELSKVGALKVISRTSVMRYKNSDMPLPQIARALGVDGVIEGSVARDGDQVRVTVQLIHGPTDHHVWAESYQREVSGILALQGEVARAIVGEIRVVLTPVERARLTSTRSVDPAAYELYVLGRHHWNQRTTHGYEQAIVNLRKAIELDPTYAPAHAALADTYLLLGEQGGLAQSEARTLAEAAIRRALELDDRCAEAYSSLGWWTLHSEWNWPRAEQAYQRAIELNPGDALARSRYGRALAALGRFDEAIPQLQRAKELDPLSIPVNAYLGQVYLYARRYEESDSQYRRTAALNPNHPLTLHNIGELYMAQGRFEEAIPELKRAVELSGQQSGVPSSHYLAMLGCAYAGANRRVEALGVQDELTRQHKRSLASTFDLAALSTALGEKEKALAWLEQGYAERDVWLMGLKAWPWFDTLRDDPRFQDLLDRMGL